MCPTRALPLQGSLASLGLGLLLCCRTSFLTPLHGGSKTAKIRGHNRVSCKRAERVQATRDSLGQLGSQQLGGGARLHGAPREDPDGSHP